MSKPQGLHKEDIKAAIRKKGETLYSLSRKAGLSKHAIAVSFEQPIPAAHKAVSKFLNIPVQEIWPQWYDADGNRKTSHSSKHSAKRPQRHSKKSPRHLTEKGGVA